MTARTTLGLGVAIAVWAAGLGAASGQALGDDPAFALYRQAVQAMEQKDYAAARQNAQAAIAEYPNHLLAYYLLGQTALAETKWAEAAEAFSKVIALYPRSFAGHRELGIALDKLGKPDEAVQTWETALKLRPDDTDVRVRLAFMLLEAGRRDQALPYLTTLADRRTEVPEVWTALGRLQYERGELPAAASAFGRAVELRDDGRTWFNLAVVRLRLDDKPGALTALQRAAKHPETKEQAEREIERLKAASKEEAPTRR
jgi:tetratricopeptide (TPR) repeat protein